MPSTLASLTPLAATLAPLPSAAQWALLLLLAALGAAAIDRLWGEPPARIHPVVGMGQYLNWAARRFVPLAQAAPQSASAQKRLRRLGRLYWLWGAILVLLPALALQILAIWLMQSYGLIWGAILLALCFKPLFAWRMLAAEVQAVEAALGQSLATGRARLAYLVSRDTRELNASGVREAAIETLAENFNDSCIAPLFYFALGGLPAAALYRYANTADASWGYRGLRLGRVWDDAGRCAARSDDALSWLPARISAYIFLIAAQAGFTRKNTRNTVKKLPIEAIKTPSPNSGWPMAAMALLLDLRLGKAGVYQLNPTGREPEAADIRAALQLYHHAWGLCMALTLLLALSLLAWMPSIAYT